MRSWCAAENYRPGLDIENYYFYLGLLTLCMSYSHETRASCVLIRSVLCPGRFNIYYYSLSNLSNIYVKKLRRQRQTLTTNSSS